VDKSVDKYCG